MVNICYVQYSMSTVQDLHWPMSAKKEFEDFWIWFISKDTYADEKSAGVLNGHVSI